MIQQLNSKTISELLKQRAMDTPHATAFMEKETGCFQGIKWKKFYEKTCVLATGLVMSGLIPGDELAILMPNSIAWELVQHAGFMAGCIVAGLDPNDPPKRLSQILEITDIKALAVQSAKMLEGLPLGLLTSLKLILIIEGPKPENGLESIQCLPRLMTSSHAGMLPRVAPHHCAIRVFTSGTTGRPRAITYDHDQLITATQSILQQIPALPDQACSACWLPLSTPFQRMINWCGLVLNLKTYMVSDPSAIMAEVLKIQPHFMAGVPRFYEKIYQGIDLKIEQQPRLIRFGIRLGEKAGLQYQHAREKGQKIPLGLSAFFYLANALVLKKIRQPLGHQIRFFISGSAPISARLQERFHAWGWLILESYGISENIIPMSMNTVEHHKFGTQGMPLKENTIKLSSEGEILVKGVGVARKDVVLTRDNYLKTGDMGSIDKNGYLRLSGRISDGFKLSTGRKIAPLEIESALKEIHGVDHAVVEGANRQYLVALLNFDADIWQQLMDRHGSGPMAKNFIKMEMDRVTKDLPPHCRPVDFFVIPTPFSVETGELTSNLKVRRHIVLKLYSPIFQGLYKRKKMPAAIAHEDLEKFILTLDKTGA